MKRSFSPSLFALLLALSPLFTSQIAAADPAATSPSGHGQQALAVRVEAAGVRVKVCASGACAEGGGATLAIPDEARAAAPRASVKVSELVGGRRLVRVDFPLDKSSADAAWTMLLAAPLTGKGSDAVEVWSGFTGVSKGEQGEGRVTVIVEEPVGAAGSARRVLVGERREDVTLCGRPTLVAAKEIEPATLALGRAASVQNLGASERAQAVKITASRVAEGEAIPGGARLLRATAASSAVEQKLGTLTDGDAETIWSENKAGAGEGEFVTMSSSDEVGVVAFTITVRPKADVEGGAAPRTLYLATPAKLYEVKLPEDAWKQPPGTRYTVKLPEELRASCVAVVLGEAYGAAAKGDPGSKLPRVTLAEVTAVTTFGAATPEALVGALAGGGERARGAAALLARGGSAASQAVIASYEKLDAAGKQLAAGVVDGAPCSEQAPFFAARLAGLAAQKDRPRAAPGELDPELAHARDKLRRCGRASAVALSQLVTLGSPELRRLAAVELSMVAPVEAVPILVDALAKADDASRHELRSAIARAVKTTPRAQAALAEELAPAKLEARPVGMAIDLLRAAGSSLPSIEGARPVFAALAISTAPMSARYLLQAPAAELAIGGDPKAEAFLLATLRGDLDPHLRARAAEVAGRVEALRPALVLAVDDPEVRVREAAIYALSGVGAAQPKGLAEALTRRLASDDWTIVRAAAARTLGALPASPPLDAALATALADLYPEVRGAAIDALGSHRATAYAEPLRKRALVAEESLDVRTRAVLALAEMCDRGSLDLFTRLAGAAVKPTDERDRRLGAAAVAALSVVHPADLEQRLSPLLAKDAPPGLNEMARSAIKAAPGCR